MLKIFIIEGRKRCRFILEGKLVGPWVVYCECSDTVGSCTWKRVLMCGPGQQFVANC
jgi:hypothetical protein